MSSFSWPPSGSGGVTIYANFAAFPASAPVGTLAIDASTGTLYEFFGGSWQVLAKLGSTSGTAIQEAPTGVVNGINVTFTLSQTPTAPAVLEFSLDGIVQRQGGGLEYTISGNTITMAVAPSSLPIPQTLWAIYQY